MARLLEPRQRPGRNRRKPQAVKIASSPIDVSIEKLGSEGAGVARVDGAPILVPDTLPGEHVRVLPAAAPAHSRLLERLTQSSDRVQPPCPHFSSCGGCALQHLSEPLYKSFKRDVIVAALRRERLDRVEVAPVIVSPPHSRRRATLAVLRRPGGVILGFHAKASHEIAAIDTCTVLTPMLEALFEPIRALLGKILKVGERSDVSLTELDNGVDLGLRLPSAPDLGQLELLLDFAEANNLTRLWWRDGHHPPQLIVERRQPVITLGGVSVQPPMGGFLQATRDGEAALIAEIIARAAAVSRIADLYAGIGTFTLPLAALGKRVHVVEGDADAIGALGTAARQARLAVTIEKRDLDLRPLRKDELQAFEVAVFDPPRAGAKAQVRIMREAHLQKIIAVSCNPATFARDAAILVAGGWQLDTVQPIDQFLWSPHIELVATFQRH